MVLELALLWILLTYAERQGDEALVAQVNEAIIATLMDMKQLAMYADRIAGILESIVPKPEVKITIQTPQEQGNGRG